MVERGPEKAGVGGSIPSLATISLNSNFDVFRAALWVLRAAQWNRHAALRKAGVGGSIPSLATTQTNNLDVS